MKARKQRFRRLVGWVLAHEFPAKGFGEDGLFQAIEKGEPASGFCFGRLNKLVSYTKAATDLALLRSTRHGD